mmetsp:Transcript_65983/g.137789  ORF Transcript_65983/g.137789 Transcript_65983/m.137789 type:complete len:340 (+) Transcript_65983:96-1115(+)
MPPSKTRSGKAGRSSNMANMSQGVPHAMGSGGMPGMFPGMMPPGYSMHNQFPFFNNPMQQPQQQHLPSNINMGADDDDEASEEEELSAADDDDDGASRSSKKPRKKRCLARRPSEDRPLSTSYKTIGSKRPLCKEQIVKALMAIDCKWLNSIRLNPLTDRQLLILLYSLTGLHPQTKISDLMVRTKGAFRQLCKTSYEVRLAEKDAPLTSELKLNEAGIQALAEKSGFQDIWMEDPETTAAREKMQEQMLALTRESSQMMALQLQNILRQEGQGAPSSSSAPPTIALKAHFHTPPAGSKRRSASPAPQQEACDSKELEAAAAIAANVAHLDGAGASSSG